MNKAIMFEIGDLIHVRYTFGWLFWKNRPLTAEEILASYEFKQFQKMYPEICKACGVVVV